MGSKTTWWMGLSFASGGLLLPVGCSDAQHASNERIDEAQQDLGPGGGCGSGGTWETEWLVVESTSAGDSHVTFSNPGLSGGKGTMLGANAANDFVVYSGPCPDVYSSRRTKVRVFRTPISGRFQLAWSTTKTGPWSNIGAVQDLYSSATGFWELDLATINYGGASPYFRFLVTGKHPWSTGYALHLDYIDLSLP